MSSSRLSDAERARIESALRDGISLCRAAQDFHRAKSTVSAIAARAGIRLERSATQKATEAARDYDLANRLSLLNRFFDKADGMVATVSTPLGLQQLATALAIMVDKRRLEDGQATARTEIAGDGVRERIAGRIDELTARRRQEGAA